MTNKQTKLTNHKATMIAEGAQEPDYPEQYVEAWQQPYQRVIVSSIYRVSNYLVVTGRTGACNPFRSYLTNYYLSLTLF
jgi:hypothetical protein